MVVAFIYFKSACDKSIYNIKTHVCLYLKFYRGFVSVQAILVLPNSSLTNYPYKRSYFVAFLAREIHPF